MKKILTLAGIMTLLLIWAHKESQSNIILNDRLERDLEEAEYYGC